MNFAIFQWEVWVVATALALLLADLFAPASSRRTLGGMAVAALALVLGANLAWAEPVAAATSPMSLAGFTLDPFALWTKRFAMLSTLLTMAMSLRFMGDSEEHPCEFLALQLFACVGMMLLGGAADLVSLFISLELMTVSFYVLVGFHRRDALGLEAAMKYLIFGALASGVLLYGIALVYAVCGKLSFAELPSQVAAHADSPLLFAGVSLILAGLAFKISAAPFHWWTPDVYEGATTPVTALLSTGSKGAGFAALVRLLHEVFPSLRDQWMPLLLAGAAASILIGNLGALSQTNLKRLMGYSSVSHSGYMLLGLAVLSPLGLPSVIYYLLGYLLANALVFTAMCETTGENPRQDIRDYAGLARRSPWVSSAMLVGLLSLSGIPPLAGFLGKLLVFSAAFQDLFPLAAHRGLAVTLLIALAGAVCSLYYYLGIVRTIYFSEPTETRPAEGPGSLARWMFALLIVGVVLAGLLPSPWWRLSEEAVRFLQP